ncbi:MAG: hypothetical protein KAU95_04060 [Candidatus Aenigmarchaeota archaeon]|nr:hypothetical protein [Candidatus Aenigmarchaeota archaeon]
MNRTRKAIIGIIIIFVLLWAGTEIYRNRNLEFEYKLHPRHFEINIDYKQYLKEGEVSKEIKKVFEENNISLSEDAKIFEHKSAKSWYLQEGSIKYAIVAMKESIVVYAEMNGGYIKNIEWEDDLLVVEAIMNMEGCPNQELFVNYKINTNTLSFFVSNEKTFIEEIFMQHCSCIECYKLRFKIKNLEKKNYKVLLYKKIFMQKDFLVDEKLISNTK